MIVTQDNLLIEEIQCDLKTSDGLIQKYDDSSNFIFANILEVGEDINNKIVYQDKNNVLILRRISKVPFLDGQYFINEKDILGIMSKDEFEKIKA